MKWIQIFKKWTQIKIKYIISYLFTIVKFYSWEHWESLQTLFGVLTQNRIQNKIRRRTSAKFSMRIFSEGYIIMGESLKFKEYCNRTVPAQYSDRVCREFSSVEILTHRGKINVFSFFLTNQHMIVFHSGTSIFKYVHIVLIIVTLIFIYFWNALIITYNIS